MGENDSSEGLAVGAILAIFMRVKFFQRGVILVFFNVPDAPLPGFSQNGMHDAQAFDAQAYHLMCSPVGSVCSILYPIPLFLYIVHYRYRCKIDGNPHKNNRT